MTARAGATSTGGASPAGNPALVCGLGAVIEAFECLDFGFVRQPGDAGAGAPGQVMQGDKSGPGQDDGGQLGHIRGPFALCQVLQDGVRASGQFAGAF